ncbi:MAG: NUDIX hydrolase [Pseudomonadales bacterium]|nr:NUDIX hydrolase [Pseudomonadales bacterium]
MPFPSLLPSRSRRLRTARCILHDGERFLLVVHAGGGRHRQVRWGLPGGHIDFGEKPEATVRRELREELRLEVGALEEIGDYRYKNAWHRVYFGAAPGPIDWFDKVELLQVGWHSDHEVDALARAGALHAGYEVDVVRALAPALREAV